MINIDKLRPFPFYSKQVAFPDIVNHDKYNFIFYPENSTLQDSYFKLNLKRQFFRKGIIFPYIYPKVLINRKVFDLFRSIKLIPLRQVKDEENNVIIDTSLFLDALDLKFKKASYRRPVVMGRIMNYLQVIKSSVPPGRKNVFVYYVDYNKHFSELIWFRRIWPVFVMLAQADKQGNMSKIFDYFLIASGSSGTVSYSSLITPNYKPLKLSRILTILRSQEPLQSEAIEQVQKDNIDKASINVVNELPDKPKSEQEKEDTTKVHNIVKDYLKKNETSEAIEKMAYQLPSDKPVESIPIKHSLEVTHQEKPEVVPNQQEIQKYNSAINVALKSILYAYTGKRDLVHKVVDNIPVDKKIIAYSSMKKNLLSEIVEEDPYKNISRDNVFKNVKIHDVNDNKNPSKVLNKRIVDFKKTFEKDLMNSFQILQNQKEYPLKIKKFIKEPIPIDPGDLQPSKYVTYTIVLQDDLKNEHIVEVTIPEIQEDGSFILNGKKKFLIYQIILDPIYFIKAGQAKLETLYAAVAVHHKHTVHKSYYELYLAGYSLPLVAVLGYHIGFVNMMKLFGIRYKITKDAPQKGVTFIPLSDDTFIWYEAETEVQKRMMNSFFEMPLNIFTSENILNKQVFQTTMIKITKNMNCMFKIDKVLDNIMEPVAVQILRSKLLPITFEGCIYYICDELAKGRVDKRNNLDHSRVRSSEVFAYQIQKMILASYTEYFSKRKTGDKKAQFRCDTRKIVSDIVVSELVRDLENINPIEELSSLTRVTPVGPGGIPDGNALTAQSRSIDESYYGNIDPVDTPEGGNIGMINQLTIGSAITNTRGTFITDKEPDEKAGMLSPTTAMIPFIGSCDGARVMLASSQAKQAIPIAGREQPLVQTGYETIMSSMLTDAYVKKSPVDGIINKMTQNVIYVRGPNKNMRVPIDPHVLNSNQGQDSLNIFTPTVKEGQRVKKGQIIAEGNHIKDGVISLGTNLLVAIMGWKGYSFEDGFVISDKIADGKLVSDHYEEVEVDVQRTDSIKFISVEGRQSLKGEPLITLSSKNIETLINTKEGEMSEGQIIKKSPGGKIISIEVYPNISLKQFPILEPAYTNFRRRWEETRGPFPEKFLSTIAGTKQAFTGIRIIFKIQRHESTKMGDKITNNYGGKGVITLIEKHENMPKTPWGEHVDVILNPLAIVSRMNVSTLYEMYVGLIAKFMAYKLINLSRPRGLKLISDVYSTLDRTESKKLSKSVISSFMSLSDKQYSDYMNTIRLNNFVLPIIIPPFKSPTKEDIYKALSIVDARPSYHLLLPEMGRKTINRVACGYIYFKKLEQQAESKLSARSIGKYETKTLQPTAGKSLGGGQRLGEFDTWCMAGHGAPNLIKEFFGPMSDDQAVKEAMVYDIIQNGESSFRESKFSPTRNLLNVYFSGMLLGTSISKTK